MGMYYLPCVFCRWEADEFSYMSLHSWIGICLFHNIPQPMAAIKQKESSYS